MVKKLLSFRGFTLIEIMVAMGVMALGALGVMQMAKIQSDVQRKSKELIGSAQVINIIQRHLSRQESCERTFGAASPLAGSNFDDNTAVNQVISVSGGVLARQGAPLYPGNMGEAGNVNSVVITNMTIQGRELGVPNVNNEQVVSFFLEVTTQRLGDNLNGGAPLQRTARLPFPIQVRRDLTTNTAIECVNEITSAAETVKMETCSSVGGIYEPPTGLCRLEDYQNPVAPSDTTLTSIEYLRNRFDSFIGFLRDSGTFALSTNPVTSLSQRLTMDAPAGGLGANLIDNNPNPPAALTDAISRGDVQSPLLGPNCPAGQMGLFVGGRLTCRDLSCASSGGVPRYLKGISATGDAICRDLVTLASGSPGNCPYGGSLTVSSSGTLEYVCGACTPTLSCAQVALNICVGQPASDSCGNTCPGTRTTGCGGSTGGTTGGGAPPCNAGASCTSNAQCGSGTCVGASSTPALCREFGYKRCSSGYQSSVPVVSYEGLSLGQTGSTLPSVNANSSTTTDAACCTQVEGTRGSGYCVGGRSIVNDAAAADPSFCTGAGLQRLIEGTYFTYVPAAVTPGTCSCSGGGTPSNVCGTTMMCHLGRESEITCYNDGTFPSTSPTGGTCAGDTDTGANVVGLCAAIGCTGGSSGSSTGGGSTGPREWCDDRDSNVVPNFGTQCVCHETGSNNFPNDCDVRIGSQPSNCGSCVY